MTIILGVVLVWQAVVILLAAVLWANDAYTNMTATTGRRILYTVLGAEMVGGAIILVLIMAAAGVGLIAKGVGA